MRQLVLFALIIPLIGTGCSSPDARAAAVRVEVTYSFKAGCIIVRARDASAPERETSDEIEVLGRGPSTVRFAVFRKEDWGRTLEITTTAREQSCQGAVVDEQVSTVELQQPRVEPLIVTLEAPDTDGDGYMPTVSGGTDCDDENEAIRPSAAEICDTRDNDCDGSTNEGVGTNWYPDNDGDSFGDKSATPRVSCDEPPGIIPYVQNNSDCQDSDATIFPRASEAPETRCDNEDDDCDGTVDDGFEAKGAACSSPCAGQYICNPSRTGLMCNGPMLVSYHVDADGDGAGAQGGAVAACPGMGPSDRVNNSNDCDDADPHRKGGGIEVCDSRDNTCDMQIDEGNVCTGKGWKESNDGALIGTSRDWQTVAVGPGGLPVWVAGLGGVLAVRTAAEQPFISRDGACNTRNWRAAWVRPSDGHVFLAGDGAQVAQHTGTTCINATQVPSSNNLTGIIGFVSGTTTVLYVVDEYGRLYAWTPGSTPEERYNLTPPTYFGIHGLSSSLLLSVGGLEDLSGPTISGYPGTGGMGAVMAHTLNGISGTTGSLRAVWMSTPQLAYAVGDNGLVMKWSGGTSWDRVSAPTGATAANFTSVGMLDAHSIYVTDTEGRIWLRTATRWVDPPLRDTDKPLRDIAVTSRMDIWAVGDDGRVLHFAE
ncbi:MAG TPA: putative metal-binding motif-containing protein [Myxococcaceae bacterium]|nr:putative metal-binding motif-containing protein [Myxococcaceae bacterium]